MTGVLQGDTITLEATFYNLQGFLDNPTDLKVSVYPYGKRPGGTGVTDADAVILEATPLNISLGTFSYDYPVPEGSQVGTWYSYWTGTISGTTVKSVIEFEVTPNVDDPFPASWEDARPVLQQNNVYIVKLDGVLSTDGDSLSEVLCWFTSEYYPMCTSYESVMAKLNGFVDDISVDMVNFLIYEATSEAHSLTPSNLVPCNENYLQFACKQYVELAVMFSVVSNLAAASGNLKSKQLGDLKVGYQDNTQQVSALLDRWLDDLAGWERVLNSAGCITFGQSLPMEWTVQGICHPDRPPVGRQIREPVGSRQLANGKTVLSPRTRYQHSYNSPTRDVITGDYDWFSD